MKAIEMEWENGPKKAWKRNNPYRYEQDAYFDKKEENIIFLPHSAIFNSLSEKELEFKDKVNNNIERYIEIEPIHHFTHHDIFSDFFQSIEYNMKNFKYKTEPIETFKKLLQKHCSQKVFKKIWSGWEEYHNKALKKKAESWFAEHGYEVRWI